MLNSEQLKKIRSIEFSTRRLLDDLMSGGFRSSFKGQGVQFSEHRVYVPGDDIRHIDWKVSARTREPLVKKFEEERELSVLLVVDGSASLGLGSNEKTKSEIAIETAGMLAYSAAMSGDKVGLVVFSEVVEKVIPLKKGKTHVSRILAELMESRKRKPGTDISQALETASRLMKHRGIIIIVSDFIDDDYEVSLRRLARRHDVIAIHVYDRIERAFPKIGFLQMIDAESQDAHVVNTKSYLFSRWIEDFNLAHQTDTQSAWKAGKVDSLQVQTADDPSDLLVRFFNSRLRRRR